MQEFMLIPSNPLLILISSIDPDISTHTYIHTSKMDPALMARFGPHDGSTTAGGGRGGGSHSPAAEAVLRDLLSASHGPSLSAQVGWVGRVGWEGGGA